MKRFRPEAASHIEFVENPISNITNFSANGIVLDNHMAITTEPLDSERLGIIRMVHLSRCAAFSTRFTLYLSALKVNTGKRAADVFLSLLRRKRMSFPPFSLVKGAANSAGFDRYIGIVSTWFRFHNVSVIPLRALN